MKVWAVLLIGFVGLAMGLPALQKPEAFEPGRYPIFAKFGRRDPDPRWVPVPWQDQADKPFLALRKEADEAVKDPTAYDKGGKWAAKARPAYKIWLADSQNPLALARASVYHCLAQTLDPEFHKAPDYSKMHSDLNIGWMILQKVPPSYEFVRWAYLFNAGDSDAHKYRDLGSRLVARNPNDRAVACSLVAEYRWRKPTPEFEALMFSTLERCSKLPNWRGTDEWAYALAYRLYGRNYRKASAYKTALAKAKVALTKLPVGYDKGPVERWIARITKEAKDPNFGVPPGFKWLDDIDP